MEFIYDKRLGIPLPQAEADWTDLSTEEQTWILQKWEEIRGQIPDRIKTIEQKIHQKQTNLESEEDFSISCQLNYEISELASIINDLWLWYRTSPAIYNEEKDRQHY
ncbi:MAG TPA: hypothetical protein VEY51_03250 [Chondromyces sp.]|nr:hypothetical protein [Chondromyces sp.]